MTSPLQPGYKLHGGWYPPSPPGNPAGSPETGAQYAHLVQLNGRSSALNRCSLCPHSRFRWRPITTAATVCAPASFRTVAALCTLAPVVHVSSMTSTAAPGTRSVASYLRRSNSCGATGTVDLPSRRRWRSRVGPAASLTIQCRGWAESRSPTPEGTVATRSKDGTPAARARQFSWPERKRHKTAASWIDRWRPTLPSCRLYAASTWCSCPVATL